MLDTPPREAETPVTRPTAPEHLAIDARLPVWARRSHPIVRRELGAYWKIVLPDLDSVGRIYLFQLGFLLLSLAIPFVFDLLLPAVTVSLVALPIAFGVYGYTLVQVVATASASMADERRNGTLPLLLTIPLPAYEIVLGKAAAAVWRHTETLTLIVYTAMYTSLPLLIIQYAALHSPIAEPFVMRAMTALMLGAGALRVLLEPILAAALGVLLGASSGQRALSTITGTLLVAAYLALLNLPRLLPMAWGWRVLLEIVAPVVLPIALAGLALWLTVRGLRD